MKTNILTPQTTIAFITMLSNFRVVKGLSVQTNHIEEDTVTSLIEMRSAVEGTTECNDVCNLDDIQTKEKQECSGCLTDSNDFGPGYYDGYLAGKIL